MSLLILCRLRVVWAILFVILASVLAVAHEGLHEQIAEVTSRIRREPKNAMLYLRRGELYRLHRDWGAALADFRQADVLNPHLNIVAFSRGRMYQDAGNLAKAKFWLDHFLSEEPDHGDALITRARVLSKLGAYDHASRDYSKGIALLPRVIPEYYIERSSALIKSGKPRAALQSIDEGIKRLGAVVTLELLAIDIELMNKRYEAALSRLELIAAQSPRKEVWLARRGEILHEAGRKLEARVAFQSALAAIEQLPARHRNAKATVELDKQIRAALSHNLYN
jgi:tetratricopeptide (TPR) repeat protein